MTAREFLQKPIVKRIIRIFCLLFAGLIIAHLVLKEDSVYWQDMTFHSMSTYVTYRVYLRDKESAAVVFKIVKGAFDDTNAMCNRFDSKSELARLNASAYNEPFKCSPELWALLMKAREMYELSDGAFDITVGPLTAIWKDRLRKSLPTPEEIAAAKAKVGLDKVVFDENEKSVRFTVEGMSLDLGGIAKGAALDLTKQRLDGKTAIGTKLSSEAGWMECLDAHFRGVATDLNCGFINVGGNVITLSEPPPKEKSYKVQIKDPFNPKSKGCAFAEMLDESISTSGNYERYITINNKLYTHIIDPVSGYPVENMYSVTVITKHAVDADALSTAIFIKGKDFAAKMKKKYPDLRVLMFYRDPAEPDRIQTYSIGDWQDLTVPDLPIPAPVASAPETPTLQLPAAAAPATPAASVSPTPAR